MFLVSLTDWSTLPETIHTGEDESFLDLSAVEVGPDGLVNLAGDDLSDAGGASSGAARVRQIQSLFLRRIQDVLVLRALDQPSFPFGVTSVTL
ncbi:unnamed protein product [Cuscuta campestris]|uniref:Uncharacterized protein n=1 Tax=Cuscuta campestris TaxID=132261 RepID=A0A484N631_9ASTE|nr:unnamed protein product [Cuscuta campestris]